MDNVGALGISLKVDSKEFITSINNAFKAAEGPAAKGSAKITNKLMESVLKTTRETAKAERQVARAAAETAKATAAANRAEATRAATVKKTVDAVTRLVPSTNVILRTVSKLIPSGSSILTLVTRITRTALSGVKNIFKTVKNIFKTIATTGINVAKKLLNSFKNIFSNKNTGIDSFSSKLKNMLVTLGSVLSLRALYNFGKEAVEAGSELTELQNVVDTIFPHMTEQVQHFADTSIRSMGLSEQQVKKYMGNLGSMLSSAGFNEEQAFIMSKNMTQLSADVASFRNMENDDVYTKFTAIISGQTKSMRELGVDISKAAVSEWMLKKGYTETYDQLTYNEKILMRYKKVMEELDYASGDFLKTQRSWANQTRILSNLWLEFKTNIGQGLINILTPVLNLINKLLEKLVLLGKRFKEFTISVFGDQSIVSNAKNTAEEAMDGVEEAVDDTAKKIRKTVFGFDELNILNSQTDDSSENLELQDGLADAYAEQNRNLDEMNAKLDKIEAKMKKLKDEFLGFFKLRLDILDFNDSLENIKNSLKNITKWFSKNNIGNSIIKSLARVSGDIVGTGAGLASGLIKGFEKFLNSNGERLTNAWFRIINNIDRTSENLTKIFKSEQFSSIVSNLLSIWTTLKTGIIEGITIISEGITEFFSDTEILNLCQSFFDFINQVVQESTGYITNFFTNLFNYINSPEGRETLQPLIDSFERLGQMAKRIWDDGLSPLFKKISGKEGVEGLVEVITPVMTNITNFIADVLDGIGDILIGERDTGAELSTAESLVYNIYDAFCLVKEAVLDILGVKDEDGDGVRSFKEIVNQIPNIIDKIKSGFDLVIQTVAEVIGTKDEDGDGVYSFKEILDRIKEIILGLPDFIAKVGDAFRDVLDVVKEIVGFVGKIIDTIDVIKGIKESVEGAVDVIAGPEGSAQEKQGKSEVIDALSGIGHNTSEEKTVAAAMKNKISKEGSLGLSGKFKYDSKSGEFVYVEADGTIKALSDSGELYSKSKKGAGGIRAFASGGYIRANQPQLAIVGDNKTQGEVISPEDKMYEIFTKALADYNKTQGEKQPIVLNNYTTLDGKVIYQETKKLSYNESNRQGSKQYR